MAATKLSRFCEGVLEAGWLTALVVAPLFFNTYSSRTFEPDKISLVRSTALIMAAAWMIKLIEEGRARRPRGESPAGRRPGSIRIAPLALPVAFLLSAYLVSTLLSVTPRISFWGSYTRLQGTYTLLAYVIVFAAIATHIRRQEQVERLISVVILASLPASLYGVLQRLQLDPLPWGEDTTQRVTSTLGNAIFIGAYLIMVIPLTAARLIQSSAALLRGDSNLGRHIAHTVIYASIAAMQLLALWFSGSRGPWLGFLAGIFFWAVLLAMALKRRRIALIVLGTGAAAAAFLILLNIPNGPLETLRSTERLGRLGRIFETEDGTSKVRLLIWQGAVDMALPHDPLVYPDGSRDALNALRPLVGYGPESMFVAYNPFYSPAIAHYERRTASPDRSHNETFDALITTGVLGLLAYLFLFAAVFYFGLTWIGLLTPRDKLLYASLYVGGGVAGAGGLVAWRGPAYFGAGLPFGMLVGLLLFLTYLALSRPPTEVESWRAYVIAALLGGVVAHFTEIHFGIAIAATRLHFWASAGALVAVGWGMAANASTAPPAAAEAAPGKQRRARRAEKPAPPTSANLRAFAPALLTAVILITMGYNYLVNASRSTSPGEMFLTSLTVLYSKGGGTSYGIGLMFVAVWVAASALLSQDAKGLAATLTVSAALWLVFAFFHLAALRSVALQQPANTAELLATIATLGNLFAGFNVWLFLLIAAAAASLAERWPSASASGRLAGWLALATFGAAAAIAYFTNMLPVEADMTYRVARPWDRQGRWEVAIPIYEAAVKQAPLEDQYYLFLGRAYLEAAGLADDSAKQDSILNAARQELEIAQTLNPLNPDHAANLARLSQRWARLSADASEAEKHAAEAERYYSSALMLSPNSAALWNEWARFTLNVQRNYAGARPKLEKSLALDPQFGETHALWGDYWSAVGKAEADEGKRRADYEQAVDHYLQAIAMNAADPADSGILSTRLGLAAAYRALKRWDDAVVIYKEVIAAAGADGNLWAVYNALAESYYEEGDRANALDYAKRALTAAPTDSDKAAVQMLIDKIEKK